VEIQGTKWKDPHPRRQKNPPKRVNHKGNIKFLNPSCNEKHIKEGKGNGAELVLERNIKILP
jgi:hypothetical protein